MSALRGQRVKDYQNDSKVLDYNRRQLNRLRRGKGFSPFVPRSEQIKRVKGEIKTYKTRARGNLEEAIKLGASKGHRRADLAPNYRSSGTKAPAVQDPPPDPNPDRVPHVQHAKRPSPPPVKSRKKAHSRPPKVKLSAAEDKKRYQNLQKNRAAQSAENYKNYGDDDASRKKSKGQKKYNAQTKQIQKSRYSWASHKAAMARRGKKATQASYAKFKRYNGI